MVVTADEILPVLGDLTASVKINNRPIVESSVRESKFLHSLEEVVSYLSLGETLYPGFDKQL